MYYIYIYSSQVNTYDNPPLFSPEEGSSASIPTSLKCTCATPLAHPSLLLLAVSFILLFLSLFTGNYIDRSFSSSSGNIGERRPRRSPRYPTLLASSFNLLFLHHFILSLSSLPNHRPPATPSARNLLFSSISLSFHFVSLPPSLSISISVSFSRFPPLRTHPTIFLCFSLPTIAASPSLFRPLFSVLLTLPPLFHDVPDKRE